MKRMVLPSILLALSTLLFSLFESHPTVQVGGYLLPLGLAQLIVHTCIILCLAWLLKISIELFLNRVRGSDKEVPRLLIDVIGVLIFVGAIIMVISLVFDKPVGGLLATSGLIVAILGFALQSTFSNIFSGIALNIENPFHIGDWLQLDSGEVGKVTDCNWRATRLLTIEGRTIVIPNGKLAEKTFTNLNAPERYYRIKQPIHVAYSAPTDRVENILASAIKATEGIVKEMPSVVLLEGCSERGVLYTLNYWVPDYPQSFGITNRAIANALNYLDQAGLIPSYPKRDIAIHETPRQEINRKVDILNLLKRVELFQLLNDDSLKRLQQKARLIDFEAGTVIVHENESGDSLFVVVSGLLEVLKSSPNGQLNRVAVLSPGQILGEMSLLTGSPRNATVTAQTPVALIEVKKDHFEPILRQNPELINLITEIQLKRQEANETMLSAAGEKLDKADMINGDSLRSKIIRFFKLG